MIRRLRRRHRLTWVVLLPILAILLAVALLFGSLNSWVLAHLYAM